MVLSRGAVLAGGFHVTADITDMLSRTGFKDSNQNHQQLVLHYILHV